jgi:hypothetical protein
MKFGFSHCYHLHLSLFPWDPSSLSEKLERAFEMMRRAGANSFRPHIHWNRVEPVILNPGLKIADVTDKLVQCYAEGDKGIFWHETDLMLEKMATYRLEPLLCLGAGYQHQLPVWDRRGHMVKFDPAFVSREHYLGHLYLHARAVVRRYREKCLAWQLENELNGAGETAAILRWRLGLKWFSCRMQTDIITTLYRAVKEESPEAKTTHNIWRDYKDIPHIYSWKKDLICWEPYTDILGIDLFPNYSCGMPLKIRETLERAATEIRRLGFKKPLYILEDGYPVKPESRGFSEENQAEYYRLLLDACEKNNIDGLYIYCFSSQEGSPGNEWHKQRKFNGVEDWWGVVRADGTLRPAYHYLVNRMEDKKHKKERVEKK